jgi:hypothetical protein
LTRVYELFPGGWSSVTTVARNQALAHSAPGD